MFNSIFSILRPKKKVKTVEIAGFIPAFDDIQNFKTEHNLKCTAETISELIRYLDSRPNQKWYVFKSARKKSHPINVGVFEEFPTLDNALEWLETYGGGKYFIKPLSLGKCKLGYYEFEGEDIFPEPEETGQIRTNPILKKWKPKNIREAVLIQKAQEGDEKALSKLIGDDQPQPTTTIPEGVSLKEHYDKLDELREELHKKDMLVIEERFKKEKGSGWDAFLRMMESDSGKELGKEAMETVKEIFGTVRSGKREGEEKDTGSFEDYKKKSLPPANEPVKKNAEKDFTPLKLMCSFIEKNGDPSTYLEVMSISYPEHPFCHTFIVCETVDQFLEKLKSLKPKLPLLFGENGRAWLEELFKVITESKKAEAKKEADTALTGAEVESKIKGESV